MLIAQHEQYSIEFYLPAEQKKEHEYVMFKADEADKKTRYSQGVVVTLGDMIQFIKSGDLPPETIKELVYQLGG